MKKLHTKDFLGKFSIFSLSLLVLPCLFPSCQNEEDLSSSKASSTMLKLNVVMPLESVTVGTGYESGSKEENSISNYRIYIYDTDNKYITSLNNPTTDVSDTELNTVYTITAEITDNNGVNPLEGYSDFKVVMLANWEEYVTPQASSTLEELCESEYAQYSAFTNSSDFDLASSRKHIPYYGVHEYTGVTFPKNDTKYLSGNLTLLRAMAKVEIIIDCEDDEDDNITLSSATLHNYNSKGYCAPSSVYSQEDYGQAQDWENDYTSEVIHLVNGQNDGIENEIDLYKVQDKMRDANGNVTQKETWIAYVPEYDNKNDDFSYIDIRLNDQSSTDDTQYKIYFALYDEDGTTKAYDEDATNEEKALRRDIHRNNLYRFNVDFGQSGLKVNVVAWENVFDNTWTYGDMSQVIKVDDDIEKDGVMYRVVTSDYNEDTDTYTLEVWIEKGHSQYVGKLGQFNIPETVTYLGYTYTVVGISANCFDADEEVISIDIPATVRYIGDYAFSSCISLESLFFHSDYPPECGENLFPLDDDINLTIYVPLEMADNYDREPWNTYKIQETSY
ncbi:MAG: leucine-rich repeat domain-containing protein [Prevotella sp.]|nr:leucine-rich repeat domain-containing protein [Prevotella sp.]